MRPPVYRTASLPPCLPNYFYSFCGSNASFSVACLSLSVHISLGRSVSRRNDRLPSWVVMDFLHKEKQQTKAGETRALRRRRRGEFTASTRYRSYERILCRNADCIYASSMVTFSTGRFQYMLMYARLHSFFSIMCHNRVEPATQHECVIYDIE